jgi:mannose-6-phosphate isomerase-like protein (cupin superfamily)
VRWYRESQEKVLYWNHAIVHPPVDRNRPPDEVADVFVHVEEEKDNGLIVSGAKVVAAGSAITHMNFIAHFGIMLKKREFALICTVPMGAPVGLAPGMMVPRHTHTREDEAYFVLAGELEVNRAGEEEEVGLTKIVPFLVEAASFSNRSVRSVRNSGSLLLGSSGGRPPFGDASVISTTAETPGTASNRYLPGESI